MPHAIEGDMSYYSSHYRDNQEIHAGDLIWDGNEESLVTVVLDSEEALPQWQSWLASLRGTKSSGFLCQSKSGPVFCNESNEDEVLIRRGVRVPDPHIVSGNGPFTVQFYDAGSMGRENVLNQDPAAMCHVRIVRSGVLAQDSRAAHILSVLLDSKAGHWRYSNVCVIPVMVIMNDALKLGIQGGWIMANVNEAGSQLVAELTDDEYKDVFAVVAECLAA